MGKFYEDINTYVLNRHVAENSVWDSSDALISISTGDDDVVFNNGAPDNLLRLRFSDSDSTNGDKKGFSSEDAKRIYNFVDWCIGKGIKNIFIHCDAGMSRSPAVAMGIEVEYNLKEEKELIRRYPFYNKFIYRTMIETAI